MVPETPQSIYAPDCRPLNCRAIEDRKSAPMKLADVMYAWTPPSATEMNTTGVVVSPLIFPLS